MARCGYLRAYPLENVGILSVASSGIAEDFDNCMEQIGGAAALSAFKYDGLRSKIHVNEDGEV
jgi:hypothetical protein